MLNNIINKHVHRRFITSVIIQLFCSFLVLLFFSSSVLAQQNNLQLAKTPYATREDLDILFANSTRVLEYLEGEELQRPIFLSLITEEQKQNLTNKGLKPQILDENTDLSRYILLWHPQPNQSSKLSKFGEVFEITKQHTLLKLSPDKEFVHTGIAAEFFEIPFSDIVVTPPLRSKKAPTPTPATTTTVEPPQPPPSVPEPIIKPTLFIIIFFLAGLGLFFFLQTKGVLSARNHQLIYFSILFLTYILLFLLIRPDTGADIAIPPDAVF